MKRIESLEEAETYCNQHPTRLAHIYTLSENDSGRHHKALNKKIGKVFTYYDNHRKMKFAGKVIARNVDTVYDAQYIFFNGYELSKEKIDSLRHIIMNELKTGTSFESLVRQYSMDKMLDGKLLEVRPDILIEPFDKACREHKENEVFMLDIPENNWYYVARKLKGDYYIEFTKLLSVKYAPLTNSAGHL